MCPEILPCGWIQETELMKPCSLSEVYMENKYMRMYRSTSSSRFSQQLYTAYPSFVLYIINALYHFVQISGVIKVC